MNKIKAMLLSFVKPLILSHIADLSMLSPILAKVLMDKTHMSQDQANTLSMDLIGVIESEISVLINKL